MTTLSLNRTMVGNGDRVMGSSISRMQFLRGDFRGRRVPIRPPWSLAESEFVERCTACGECIQRCPTGILQAGRGGFPQVDFSKGECEFCAECAEACEPAAITHDEDAEPWRLSVSIGAGCIAYNGVVCRSCGEQCEERAISFRLVVGGAAHPRLESGACSGCGACFAPCPVGAIEIQTVANEVSE